MARTKASVGTKVTSVKSSKARAAAPPPPPPPSKRKGGKSKSRSSLAGCNPAHPRDTPDWQLPITRFFQNKDCTTADSSGSSNLPDNVNSSDESNYKNESTPESLEQGSSKTPDDDSSDETDNEIESKPELSEQSFKKRKVNVIESDDDCAMIESLTDHAADSSFLETSVDLPPLDGESSHKIAEYFPKADDKIPRTVADKENIDKNVVYSLKKNLEEGGCVSEKVKFSD